MEDPATQNIRINICKNIVDKETVDSSVEKKSIPAGFPAISTSKYTL